MRKERESIYHQVKVVCDNCNKNIKVLTGELYYDSETKLKVEGFRCNHCGTVYVTLISDNKLRASIATLRDKQYEMQQLVKKQQNDYQFYLVNKRSIPQEIIKRWEKRINTVKNEIDTIIKKNKTYEKMLKRKYLKKGGKIAEHVYAKTK